MLFTMVLNLLTTRFVLAALGVEDMGVYGVVGSIVSMFTVFVSGLLSATQRFITFELGKPNGDVSKVFNTSINLILLLSVGLFIIMEFGGMLMVEYGLNIPQQRIMAAHWVLQFSILTCILSLNTTVYNALVIAHERMGAWAAISIVQVVFNCFAAYSLGHFAEINRLIIYAIFTFFIQLVVQVLYVFYCRVKFSNIKYKRHIDKRLVREMAKFAGASSASGILQMVISQGLVLVINWTYGVAVNAVYNIGLQVKNAVLSFGLNINKAVQPQITKTYASGEFERHEKLVYSGSKMGAYMIMFILFPFCFHSHIIMKLWLGNVPPYASEFAVAFVFQSLLYASFEPFRAAVLATGNVGKFFIYSEIIHLVVLPLAYWTGTVNDTPVTLVIVIVVWEFVYCASMVWLGSRVSKIKVKGLLKIVLFPCFVVGTISLLVYYVLKNLMGENILSFVIQTVIGSFCLCLIILFCGTNRQEKGILMQIINRFILRNRN